MQTCLHRLGNSPPLKSWQTRAEVHRLRSLKIMVGLDLHWSSMALDLIAAQVTGKIQSHYWRHSVDEIDLESLICFSRSTMYELICSSLTSIVWRCCCKMVTDSFCMLVQAGRACKPPPRKPDHRKRRNRTCKAWPSTGLCSAQHELWFFESVRTDTSRVKSFPALQIGQVGWLQEQNRCQG